MQAWLVLALLAAVCRGDADLLTTFEFWADPACSTFVAGISARNVSSPAVCAPAACSNGVVVSCRVPVFSSFLTANLTGVVFFVSFLRSDCTGRVFALQAYPAAPACASTQGLYSCDASGSVAIQGFADSACSVPTNATRVASGCSNGFFAGGCGNATALPSGTTSGGSGTPKPAAAAAGAAAAWLLAALALVAMY